MSKLKKKAEYDIIKRIKKELNMIMMSYWKTKRIYQIFDKNI